MKLSTKMRISFGILIIVPACLFILAAVGIVRVSMRNFEIQYDASGTSYTALANPIALVTKMCESEYNKLVESSANSTEDFANPVYLDNINKGLKKSNSYLLVVEDGECIYAGNSGYEEILKSVIETDLGDDKGIYLKEYNVMVNNVNYTSVTGKTGTAFVVMQIKDIIPQVKNLLYDGIVAIVVVLVLTSGAFVSWMYRTMVNPINRLKLATRNIKDGNLDFDMDVSGKDEISELCRDFDEMRERLKENAEEKVRADAESKELISNISHDLKTPITTIKGYVEGIMDGVADTPEKLDRYVKTIYNQACDMDKLIDELTFYSKIDSNKIVYNFTKIYVNEYFEGCAKEYSIELDSKGIEFIYESSLPDNVIMMADAEQFKKVINNIINNSVKYMGKENGTIRISVKDLGTKIGMDISDNGQGIPAKALPFIFDRFYRADSSRSQHSGGSGIGLSIVKKIIYDHDGTIGVDSEEGKGTTMHIVMDKFIPVNQPAGRLRE